MQEIKSWFDRAGVAIAIMPDGIPTGRFRSNPAVFAMTIRKAGRKGEECVQICPGDGTTDVHAVDADPRLHQVVLRVKEPRRTFVERGRDRDRVRVTPARWRTLLVGKDQTHLFIADVPNRPRPANTVKDAHRALRPAAVIERSRDTGRIKRQGEWFFIPATAEEERAIEAAKLFIVRHAPIGGRRARAHVAEELVITEKNGTFVRGRVRHPDHRSLELVGWFRVVANTELRRAWVDTDAVRWMD